MICGRSFWLDHTLTIWNRPLAIWGKNWKPVHWSKMIRIEDLYSSEMACQGFPALIWVSTMNMIWYNLSSISFADEIKTMKSVVIEIRSLIRSQSLLQWAFHSCSSWQRILSAGWSCTANRNYGLTSLGRGQNRQTWRHESLWKTDVVSCL